MSDDYVGGFVNPAERGVDHDSVEQVQPADQSLLLLVEAEASAEVVRSHPLAQAFMMQRNLQTNSYGYDFESMTDEDRCAFITWNVLALTDELHEALAEVGWKPWASSRHVNREAFVGELVDAFHFFMNLGLAVGLTGDELYAGYLEKQALNAKRQEDGYDGVSSKCPGCGRALDDPATGCRKLDPPHFVAGISPLVAYICNRGDGAGLVDYFDPERSLIS